MTYKTPYEPQRFNIAPEGTLSLRAASKRMEIKHPNLFNEWLVSSGVLKRTFGSCFVVANIEYVSWFVTVEGPTGHTVNVTIEGLKGLIGLVKELGYDDGKATANKPAYIVFRGKYGYHLGDHLDSLGIEENVSPMLIAHGYLYMGGATDKAKEEGVVAQGVGTLSNHWYLTQKGVDVIKELMASQWSHWGI